MPRVRVPLVAIMIAFLIHGFGTQGTVVAQTPAQLTPTEAAYLASTEPFRGHLGAYQELLDALQRVAADGELDTIALADLGDLTRDLFAARRAFDRAIPSARLDRYHQTVVLGLDRAYTATVLLLRSQVTESQAEHEVLIHEAEVFSTSSGKLLRDAGDELHAVLAATAS